MSQQCARSVQKDFDFTLEGTGWGAGCAGYSPNVWN